ncbi:hypothetical protein PACTADRAFT_31880 [Pachysolen tannophilus NRRL Y-2460]|uniref:Septin-type G domain-containing protein n=1 Tax=Pachysolen tannophilus NRRL Y-2460 TaxID=669874 RepID=A0A1E4U3C8_PACTA|nr:hypothetical protein PACTADRAFT_31880 [Pachysolen tannophilus NRRL Y-2460]
MSETSGADLQVLPANLSAGSSGFEQDYRFEGKKPNLSGSGSGSGSGTPDALKIIESQLLSTGTEQSDNGLFKITSKTKHMEISPKSKLSSPVKSVRSGSTNTTAKILNSAEETKRDLTEKISNIPVGIDQITEQVKKRISREGASFTLLVAGDRALGKTTFLNTLFEPESDHEESWMEEENRTTEFSLHQAELVDKDFKLKFTAIDTPGFFDTNNDHYCWVPITNYIDEQFRLHLYQEEQPDRKNAIDSRVHACLYFITPSPTGLTASDIRAMKELSVRVNLIPVISKADTFTKEEIAKFKANARKVMKKYGIKICELLEKEELDEKAFEDIPFSLIGADSYVSKNDGTTVRGRKYNWGVAEVENDEHCDFNKLRSMLLSKNTLDFITSTELHYEKYRNELLKFRLNAVTKKADADDATKFDANGEDNSAELNVEEEEIEEKARVEEELIETDIKIKTTNPLDCLKLISSFSLEEVEDYLAEQNPTFLQKQHLIKKGFSGIVAKQEKRFKEWKSALVQMQNEFNSENQALRNKVLKLQEQLQKLESDLEEKPQTGSETEAKSVFENSVRSTSR